MSEHCEIAGTADERVSAAASRGKSRKAPHAFRTISEVADELHIPQHVLRFWETKFPQVKPLKRGGGRRYYRPDDIALLRRVSDLLYIQGYTIKGVQRLLREGGGVLADDIPPPPADDEVEQAPLALPRADVILPGGALPSSPVALPKPRLAGATEPEAERLRGLLLDALRELEGLRALLR